MQKSAGGFTDVCEFRSLKCLQPLYPCLAVEMAPGVHEVVADLTDGGGASQQHTLSLSCMIRLPPL